MGSMGKVSMGSNDSVSENAISMRIHSRSPLCKGTQQTKLMLVIDVKMAVGSGQAETELMGIP